jgi:hypothetical protein
MDYVNYFYKRLYTQDLEGEVNLQHQQECLSSVPQVVSEAHNAIFTKP